MIGQIDIVKRESIPPSEAGESSGRTGGVEVRNFSSSVELEQFLKRGSDLAICWVALRSGEVLAIRKHAHPTLVIVHGGSGVAQGDRNCALEAGDILVIPPGAHQGLVGGPAGLQGLRIELSGSLDQTSTFKGTLPPVGAELQGLLELNEARLDAFKRRPLFKLLAGGVLASSRDSAAFEAALSVWIRGRLAMMAARQASCDDARFWGPFTRDLQGALAEREDRGGTAGALEPVRAPGDARMEAFIGWFAYQMCLLDNVEKAAIVHLVLEPAEAALRQALSQTGVGAFEGRPGGFGARAGRGYRHAELFAEQSPKAYARLRNLTGEAWSMVSAMTDRLAAIAQAG